MNSKLHYALGFYVLGLSVRDTLEYVLPRENYDLAVYNAKKQVISNSLQEGSIFINFVKNNGEVGEKLQKQLQELFDLVYGVSPRFVRIDGDKIIVDRNQNLKVLDLIVPIKVSLYNICQAYFKDMSDEEREKESVDTVEEENRFFSILISMVIQDYLFKNRFVKFNEEMKAHNGEVNVEANFTSSEMSKLVSMYAFIKNAIGNKYKEYTDLEPLFNDGLNVISGKTKLEEGRNAFEVLGSIGGAYLQALGPVEAKWRELHGKLWNSLVEYEKEQNLIKSN